MTSVTSIARYRVKPDRVDEFLKVLDQHVSILRDLDLVTDREVQVYLGQERGTDRPVVFEIFDWIDDDASGRAHTHPEVSAAWESMGPLCESRDGRGPFEFENVRQLEK